MYIIIINVFVPDYSITVTTFATNNVYTRYPYLQ